MFDVIKSDGRGSPDATESATSGANQGGWYLRGQLHPGAPIGNVPINVNPFTVGRRSDVSLHLPCKAVSNIHAEFVDMGDALLLRDLGSTNGTYLNGQRIDKQIAIKPHDLIQFGSVVLRMGYQTFVTSRETACQDVMDEAMVLAQFERMMEGGGLVPHYQSIVRCADENEIGYEVLARSRLIGLQTASSMFSAADLLDQATQLSRAVRQCAVQQTLSLASPPHLLLNTHPKELGSGDLLKAMGDLRQAAGDQQLTLEIHENAITRPQAMAELRKAIRDLNIRLAFDDFGVGQMRLELLPMVQPDYLKFDISLIHSIDRASADHQRMVASLVRMVTEMGIVSLAEGVETKQEFEACMQLGFELAQGYFFSKPAPFHHIWPGGNGETS